MVHDSRPQDGPRDLLCFSHLRWDWVYQRPQHLLSRLARDHNWRVFFVEEPAPPAADATGAEAAPHWSYSLAAPHVVRCVPHFAADWPFFLSEAGSDTRTMRRLLAELLQAWELTDPVAWLYTPLAVPLLDLVPARATVYDCMDELALFKDAPAALRGREAELLRRADVVFTGGRSMYEARRGRHPNLHLFPSSVDAAHFGGARDAALPVPADARPGTPTLGFYGVLDERLDRELIDAVAALRPDWRIVLVGPVAKIDPRSLPRRPNISYPGGRPYEALPGYLKGWDVCLMPFAMNDATRFISPTKTLEYLAAGKPIVSTPIPDVVSDYRGLVRFAGEPAEFVAQVEADLGETPAEADRRQALGQAVLERTSWDATAARMDALIDEALAARDRATAGAAAVTRRAPVAIPQPSGQAAAQ